MPLRGSHCHPSDLSNKHKRNAENMTPGECFFSPFDRCRVLSCPADTTIFTEQSHLLKTSLDPATGKVNYVCCTTRKAAETNLQLVTLRLFIFEHLLHS